MVNIGLDLGHTYTAVCAWRGGRAEPVLLAKGIASLFPSAMKGGSKEADAETRKEKLSAYLEEILRETVKKLKEETIARLAAVLPAHRQREGAQERVFREEVREICQSFPFVKEVRIADKSAAAGAYWIWNNQKAVQGGFDGFLLAADCGGTTVDLTLSRVSCAGEKSSVIEIGAADAQESGEERREKAGAAYLEAVVSRAVKQRLGKKPDSDQEFRRAAERLEQDLREKEQTVRQFYEDHAFLELEELEDLFSEIEYMGNKIPVTYGLMACAYRAETEPVLKEKLEQIKEVLTKNGIDYQNARSRTFKIVMVGGFCNFYLTRRQIEDSFRLASQDLRWEQTEGQTDRTFALSLGAALIAQGALRMPDRAPCSIGLFVGSAKEDAYAVRCGEEITCGKPYFLRAPCDGNPIIAIGADVGRFVVSQAGEAGHTVELKEEWREMIRRLPLFQQDDFPAYALGFAFDDSDVLSLVFQKYDKEAQRLTQETDRVALDRPGRLFLAAEQEKAGLWSKEG